LADKFTSYLQVSVVNARESNSHLSGSSSIVRHNWIEGTSCPC